MDDLFLCPDCLELHAEPLEATLGHVARCPGCTLAAEIAAVNRQPLPEPTQLRPAA